MNRFLWPLIGFVVLVVLLAVGLNLNPADVPSPLVGKPAPLFSLAKLEAPEQNFSPKDMLGKVWLLNVWASWCVACLQEHPVLVEFSKSGVLPIYGLNYKDRPDAAKAWLAKNGNPYNVSIVDADGRVGIDYGVYGVPETFLIDKQGVIRFKQIGALTPEVLQDKVLPLLRKLNG